MKPIQHIKCFISVISNVEKSVKLYYQLIYWPFIIYIQMLFLCLLIFFFLFACPRFCHSYRTGSRTILTHIRTDWGSCRSTCACCLSSSANCAWSMTNAPRTVLVWSPFLLRLPPIFTFLFTQYKVIAAQRACSTDLKNIPI